jgi:hypothetical protein
MNGYKIHGSRVEYSDDLDLMKKVLNIYAKIINIDRDDNFLSPRLVNVLSFYMLRGYSKETKKLILESLDINVANLNQINAELTRKGCLERDKYNHSHKNLSPSLEELKNYLMEDAPAKVFVVRFDKEL